MEQPDKSKKLKIKFISPWAGKFLQYLSLGDVEFTCDENCQDYDWLVVYDEIPRKKIKSVEVTCPKEHTILITQEPAIIKIQALCYTRQFQYMLTTHAPEICKHPGYKRGAGCLTGMTGHLHEELIASSPYPKTELISAVCSRKLMTHTNHNKRHELFEYLLKHLPNFTWKGQGIAPIDNKYEALDAYKYHIAVENTISDYHWTEKLADSIMSYCLTFYCGDPKLEQILPSRSFIRIPIDNPPEALRIIQEAIHNNEYEKRLPDILEARKLLIERYNMYSQILAVIAEHENKYGIPTEPCKPWTLYERHYLRRNPINAIGEFIHLMRNWKRRRK